MGLGGIPPGGELRAGLGGIPPGGEFRAGLGGILPAGNLGCIWGTSHLEGSLGQQLLHHLGKHHSSSLSMNKWVPTPHPRERRVLPHQATAGGDSSPCVTAPPPTSPLFTHQILSLIQEKFSQMDILVLMTAAICHDLDHPGYNNTYVQGPFLLSRALWVSELSFSAQPLASSQQELSEKHS